MRSKRSDYFGALCSHVGCLVHTRCCAVMILNAEWIGSLLKIQRYHCNSCHLQLAVASTRACSTLQFHHDCSARNSRCRHSDRLVSFGDPILEATSTSVTFGDKHQPIIQYLTTRRQRSSFYSPFDGRNSSLVIEDAADAMARWGESAERANGASGGIYR